MKIGVISDVHSNLIALEKTFTKFNDEKINSIICLGDVIGIGPYPEKCIQFLIDNQERLLSFIKGNHENYLLNGIPRKNHNEEKAKPMNDEQIATHVWNHSKLNNEQVEYIKKLKNNDYIEVEGKKIIIEHYPMDCNNKFKQFIKSPSQKDIEELFNDKKADIYLFGHTHNKYYTCINEKYYINPGSLGCPINSNCASAGILEITNNKIDYKTLEIEYNIEKVIEEIKSIEYPLYDYIINKFYRKIDDKI